ncbi:MAG: hypothetical protein K8S98_08330 [Planctomycetes bacterium]|nr:hypothetical protein [Planctomycetota bacterium]
MRRRSFELRDVWYSLLEADAALLACCALPRAGERPEVRVRKLPFGRTLVETTREANGVVRCVRYFLDGRKRRELLLVDGRAHGRATAWYRDGKKRWVGEFRAGAQTGEWFFFHRTGKLDGRRTGVYENGLRFAAMKGFNDWNA